MELDVLTGDSENIVPDTNDYQPPFVVEAENVSLIADNFVDIISEKNTYNGNGTSVRIQRAYQQAISDIIESVALEETALSHILNAEGEKIQKALEMELTTAELIMLNESVKDMVNTIGRLEMILLAKLQSVECEIG